MFWLLLWMILTRFSFARFGDSISNHSMAHCSYSKCSWNILHALCNVFWQLEQVISMKITIVLTLNCSFILPRMFSRFGEYFIKIVFSSAVPMLSRKILVFLITSLTESDKEWAWQCVQCAFGCSAKIWQRRMIFPTFC